jgi:hypothetical protein
VVSRFAKEGKGGAGAYLEGLRVRSEGSLDIGVGVGVRVGAGAGADARVGRKVSWESEKTSDLTTVFTGEGDGEE